MAFFFSERQELIAFDSIENNSSNFAEAWFMSNWIRRVINEQQFRAFSTLNNILHCMVPAVVI